MSDEFDYFGVHEFTEWGDPSEPEDTGETPPTLGEYLRLDAAGHITRPLTWAPGRRTRRMSALDSTGGPE